MLILVSKQVNAQIPLFESRLIDALKNERISTLYTDQNGYLWIGIDHKGVCRFNGYNLEWFKWKMVKPDVKIQSMLQVNDSTLWIGTNRGMSRLKGGTLQELEYDGLDISDLIQRSNQDVYLATQKGIWIAKDTKENVPFRKVNIPVTKINSLYEYDNALWICSESGLYRFKNQVVHFDRSHGLNSLSVKAILKTNPEEFLVFCDGSQPQYLRHDRLENPIWDVKIEPPQYNYIYHDIDEQNVWVNTQNQQLYYADASGDFGKKPFWQTVQTIKNIKSIVKDTYGQIWISSTQGLWRANLESWYQVDHYHQVQNIKNIEVDPQQNLWLLDESGRLGKFQFSQARIFYPSLSKTQDPSRFLFKNHSGKIYLFSSSQIGEIQNNKIRLFDLKPNLPNYQILDVKQKGKDYFWMVTNPQNLYKLQIKDNVFVTESIKLPPGSHDYQIKLFEVDHLGDCWLLTYNPERGNELWSYHLQNWTHHKLPEGITINALNRSIGNTDTRLWLGSDQGLWTINTSDQFKLIQGQDQLQDLYIHHIIDNQQHIWVSNRKGITKILLDFEGKIYETHRYDWSSKWSDPSSSRLDIDLEENIWVYNQNGVFVLNPKDQTDIQDPPRLAIRKIRVTASDSNRIESKAKSTIYLPSNVNSLWISCETVCLTGESMFYQWRWNDNPWSTPSTSSNMEFTHFPTGENTLTIRVCNDKFECSSSKSLSILMAVPWYQKPIYLAGAIIGIFLLLGLFVFISQWRQRRILIYEKKNLMRKYELLSLEQQAHQNQMNPHFIFNMLNSIKGMMTGHSNQAARQKISRFAGLMRKFLNQSRQNLTSLQDEIEFITEYVAMQESLHKLPINLIWSVDSKLEPEMIHIPPMVLQPLVENAILHGILPQIKKTEIDEGTIEIDIAPFGSYLKIYVRDTGVGIKSVPHKQNHQSAGLDIIRRRLNLLIRNQQIVPLKFLDQKNSNDRKKGTTLELIVPIIH